MEHIVRVEHQPSNGWGIAGFILAIFGVVSCGVLAPLGLLLSLVGLAFQPRGLAIAGTVIGSVGCLILATVGYGIVTACLAFLGFAGQVQDFIDAAKPIGVDMLSAAKVVAVYVEEEEELPSPKKMRDLLEETNVPGITARVLYERDGDRFRLAHVGIDNLAGTEDDWTLPWHSLNDIEELLDELEKRREATAEAESRLED